jgi:hypothetical protein
MQDISSIMLHPTTPNISAIRTVRHRCPGRWFRAARGAGSPEAIDDARMARST